MKQSQGVVQHQQKVIEDLMVRLQEKQAPPPSAATPTFIPVLFTPTHPVGQSLVDGAQAPLSVAQVQTLQGVQALGQSGPVYAAPNSGQVVNQAIDKESRESDSPEKQTVEPAADRSELPQPQPQPQQQQQQNLGEAVVAPSVPLVTGDFGPLQGDTQSQDSNEIDLSKASLWAQTSFGVLVHFFKSWLFKLFLFTHLTLLFVFEGQGTGGRRRQEKEAIGD